MSSPHEILAPSVPSFTGDIPQSLGSVTVTEKRGLGNSLSQVMVQIHQKIVFAVPSVC